MHVLSTGYIAHHKYFISLYKILIFITLHIGLLHILHKCKRYVGKTLICILDTSIFFKCKPERGAGKDQQENGINGEPA